MVQWILKLICLRANSFYFKLRNFSLYFFGLLFNNLINPRRIKEENKQILLQFQSERIVTKYNKDKKDQKDE